MLAKNQELYVVNKSESLQDFYDRLKSQRPEITIPNLGMVSDIGHFGVFKRSSHCAINPSLYNRRDFYKISLIIGSGVLHYPNEQIVVKGRALLFTNPNIPYAWEGTSYTQSGYFCLFTENFIHKRNESLRESLLWRIQDCPIISICEQQEQIFMSLFVKMMAEMESEYIHKYDMLRNYIQLIVHEALKVRPADTYFRENNASVRLTSLFLELLERQFPIGSSDHVLELRTAYDFAHRLSVHVNHLNHAVKEVTGRTTSEHISKRIVTEAVALLKHTEWNVAQIAYCLGFEYPANFNIFFKRQMLCTPKSFR
ncbi:MAG: transcriptional regulator [Sphingobacteriales bacterium]|nr:transcriptional regulator [Sphingobacteriales bacterium]